MKTVLRPVLLLTALAAAGSAQQWEYAGYGGASFLNSVSVSGGPASATAGFQPGFVGGGYLGYSSSKHFGGQIRYGFMQSNLRLQSGGTEATFAGSSHVVHYDLIIQTARNEGKVQLFAAVGGGLKIFCGTGTEHASQPLYQYGYFTKTTELKPMASFGGGVKFALSKRVFLRAEVRDFLTAFPTQVIAPPSGIKYGSLLHDIVPMVGIGFEK